jgi:PST family polysaccharide transporter
VPPVSTNAPPVPRRPSPFSAGGWATVSFVISQGIGSLLYLPLARLLEPEHFGLMTEAYLVYTGLTLITELSLVRALIRLPGDRGELATATLWLSALIGAIGMALCGLAGLPLASLYRHGALRLIMLLLAPGVLLTALGAVPHALLSRELDFRRKTLPETISIGAGGLLALGAALLGAGVYSLVLYAIARAALSSGVAWLVSPWRPRWSLPRRAAMRRIVAFGLPASGGDLALYARLNADYAITGRRLGSDALGVYTLAWAAAAGLGSIIDAFFGGVGYATFARLQADRARLRAMYLSATRLIATLSLPLFLGAVFLRQEIVHVFYGDRWLGMVPALLPLLILQGVRDVCAPGASLVLATGHGRTYALCGLAMLPLTVAAVLLGADGGITGVAWAMLIAVGGASLVWPLLAGIILRPARAEVWRTVAAPLLITALTVPSVGVARLLLGLAGAPALVRFALATLAGGAVFALAGWRCWPSLRQDVARLRESLPDEAGQPAASVPPATPGDPAHAYTGGATLAITTAAPAMDD